MTAPPALDAAKDEKFLKAGLLTRICNQPVILKVGRLLNLRRLGDIFLQRLPIWSTHRSGLKRRIDSVEALFAGEEILFHPNYKHLDRWLPNIRGFIDVGVNRGYFVLHLKYINDRSGLEPIFGLAVDAHPGLLKTAKANLAANHLDQVYLFHGVVGVEHEIDFYLNPLDTRSSIFEVDMVGDTNKAVPIRVPPLKVGEKWKQLFPAKSCDLLKIDIEGAESLFMALEADFIRTVKYILVEYHGTPTTTREAIEHQLDGLGFEVEAHELNFYGTGMLFARSKNLTAE